MYKRQGYAFRLELAPSFGPVVSNPATLTLGTAPAIFRQPSGRTVKSGQTFMFSAGVTGKSPLQYQWQFNNVNLSNTGNVRGAKSPILTLSKVTSANAGKYRLIVTNPFGTATSISAALKVQ